VIKYCKDHETQQIFTRQRSRRLPPDIQQVALRKLRMLNNAHTLTDLQVPLPIASKSSQGIEPDNIAFGSMIGGAFALRGEMVTPTTSRLSITTRRRAA
jgi:hypothetical protein